MVVDEEALARRFALLSPHLDERQRRLWLGVEAEVLGRGGVSVVARAAGVSRPTVRKGLVEVSGGAVVSGRVRRSGAGRKATVEVDPGFSAALDRLVDPDTRGDPESPLRWTCKSTRQLAATLTEDGHPCSSWTVGKELHRLDYSLQANAKTKEGKQHPDRDAQFRYINDQVRRFLAAGDPVISVDTKKKELVGEEPGYKNGGEEWQPTGCPDPVGTHDFPDPKVPKAVPYGIFDLAANAGWVSVGSDHDTAAFAVETLRRWWNAVGKPTYPKARRLLVCADSGGSNGYRVRLWKTELGRFAAETGLAVTVSHFPPGTSKWNRIEHRLFSFISINWRGRPLTSHEVVVELIGATTTETGLHVHAERDTSLYPKGIKISDAELAAVSHKPHDFHGEWNYTVGGRRPPRPRTTGT
jgi:hypothetical protein